MRALETDDARLPVIVLTGFLGSGKTTLLQRWLTSDNEGETALLINEVGDVGIDHQLLRPLAPEVALLPSGCVCCSIRGELKEALVALYTARQHGELGLFKQVVLETTGLADPAPILSTLLNDPQVRHHFLIGRVVTLVDAVHARFQRLNHPEWASQVGAADTLVISKTECVDRSVLSALRDDLVALNPCADVLYDHEVAYECPWPMAAISTSAPRCFTRRREAGASLEESHGDVTIAEVMLEQTLNWTHFGIWLSMLLRAHGDQILRVKALLNVGGTRPVVLHGVQHVLHPPIHLPVWPDNDHRSRLVFICRGVAASSLRTSLNRFMTAMEAKPRPA